MFACIETVAFARKVNVTMFILMKIIIFICRGDMKVLQM